MFEFIETILAFIGLLTVLEGASVAFRGSEVRPDESAAAAHREGLDTAARISAAAFEAEHALHHAAREAERRQR